MVKITLPRAKALTGGALHTIASDIQLAGNVKKLSSNGDIIFTSDSQEELETILTHSNVITIITEGGEIEGYIMYGECNDTIYTQDVPVGLPNRDMPVLDSTAGTTDSVVKKFSQWPDHHLKQTFQSDYSKLYVLSNPLVEYLTGTQLKICVDGFGIALKTRKEYQTMVDAGQIIDGNGKPVT